MTTKHTPGARALIDEGMRCLLEARELFKHAGAPKTLARVRAAISSAKGAQRAEGYRETRAHYAARREEAK